MLIDEEDCEIVFPLFKPLSIITFLPSISNSRVIRPSSFPFLNKEEPFCPGWSPNRANSIARRIDVLPDPMSPDKITEPSGNSISSFS